MNRRTVVRLLSAGFAGGLAGCDATEFATNPTPTQMDVTPVPQRTPSSTPPSTPAATPQQPPDCPKTQGFGIEWPATLTTQTVREFVLEYEWVYYRELELAYPWGPVTPVDELDIGVGVMGDVIEAGAGYRVSVRGGGAVYTPGLVMRAEATTLPTDRDPIPVNQVYDEQLTAVLTTPASDPGAPAELNIRANNRTRVAHYARLINGFLPPEARLMGHNDDATLYFRVNETGVKLDVVVGSFHGDIGWQAWYYVDRNVVRRAEYGNNDPREATLLECRTAA